MSSFSYPARFSREAKGAFTVTFLDLPEAITSGRNVADALEQAADCLQEALAGRIVRREGIPRASRLRNGQYGIQVALYLAPKLALYQAMREKEISNVQLARLLDVSETVVRRLLNPHHDSRPEKLQAALKVLGKQISVAVEDAA
jgi:antitoxin HicB